MTFSLWLFLSLTCGVGVKGDCSRSFSRVVRNIFIQKIEPEFVKLSAQIPDDCPFSINRDIYGIQEQFKKSESISKWICLFCGKSFFDEQYLDKHYERKHASHAPQSADVACLADYCDIFRCDIVTGLVVAQYWDKALCVEAELAKLSDKCQHFIGSCIPRRLDTFQKTRLFDLMNSTICSHLTCTKYWESSEEEKSPAYTALYITASVFVLFGLLIYYFVAYSHFYTDESLLDGSRHHSKARSSVRHRSPRDGTVRSRTSASGNEFW